MRTAWAFKEDTPKEIVEEIKKRITSSTERDLFPITLCCVVTESIKEIEDKVKSYVDLEITEL